MQNDPPRIIFSAVPAALVLIDGDPALRPLPGTAYQRVINTKPLVLQDAQGATYVWAAGRWYQGSGLNGPWSVLAVPPAALTAAKDAAGKQQAFDPMPAAAGSSSAPALFVSTSPAELVITTGQPDFAPVGGLSLLELRNADHAAFLDPATNKTYLLVSGRWFTAPGLGGPWSFVAANELPADLAKIPTDDPKADALISVPGTPQAREAAIAATIPQTAKIDRKTAKLAVQYAGEPQFAPITGTNLQYATNTATQLIRVDPQHYYAVENGVWFVAPSPNGPWVVADSVPEAIYAIPPASPLYDVTYVRVYQATPEFVVAGYTPGYLGVYVAPYGTVVYGTGYYYPPYIGPVWYGYPATYGYGAGFAVGAAAGFAFGFAAGWAASPYWGPYAWHGGYVNWQHVNVTSASVYTSWHGSATVTHVAGWNGNASWGATSVHAFNPYTGRGVNSQSGHYYNSATGTEAAGRRTETYNDRTGAEHVSRTGGAYNPNTGNYAGGHAGAAYNPNTGRAGAHQTTVTGNTQNGTRDVNSRGVSVNPKTDTGVAWHNGDVYAGHDGNVYKHDDNGWSQHTSNGWQPVERSNSNVNGLDRDYQGRQYGDQRLGQDYGRSDRGGWGGGGGNWGGGRFRR